ncbi:MAG TPA: hypothetical protein DCZ94_19980 [Lentisphaeria bacterium]|nr:MAG: hypothetical protein A2X48_00230 [Lentisphaerae bacterium GWF2_49_21]HBC89226.1 hypothetical protein [Lentisphaeria bacterium]
MPVFALAGAVCNAENAESKIVTHEAPAAEKASPDYSVEVNGKSVFVYTVPTLRGGPASFAYFDFQGTVKIKVLSLNKTDSVKILPASFGIKHELKDGSCEFFLSKPANLTIEINGSYERALHLFANPIEKDAPNPDDPDVIYFGPGIHEITTLSPKSNQTVYISGGAILRLKILEGEKPVQGKNWKGNKVYKTFMETRGVQNVKVRGRGIIDMGFLPWHARTAMWFEKSKDVLVEGIIILDAPAWVVAMHNSTNVTVRNIKQICQRENSDGIDICNSQDVLVEDCFLRNNDDEICVKTTTASPDLESKNIIVRNCVIWNERARGLGITSETRANIVDVTFQDCDIIHDFSNGYDCSSLAILVSDSGSMSNIRFENIRIEDIKNTLINCWIGADMWGKDNKRGNIKGVVFKDIIVTGGKFPVSKITGFDENHLVEDMTIDNLNIQGKKINDLESGKFKINQFMKDIQFK